MWVYSLDNTDPDVNVEIDGDDGNNLRKFLIMQRLIQVFFDQIHLPLVESYSRFGLDQIAHVPRNIVDLN